MNVLTFKNQGDLKITGNVKINGQFLQDPQQLSAISAYVFSVLKYYLINFCNISAVTSQTEITNFPFYL